MSVRDGSEFMLEVETTTPNSFVLVDDLTSYTRNRARETTRIPVFDSPTPRTIRSARDETFSIGGILNDDDPGQQRLRAVEQSDAAVRIRVTSDGVNGFTQSVKVNSTTHETTPDDFQLVTFDMTPEAEPVKVGTGGGLLD